MSEPIDRFVEADELWRDTQAWRHGSAAAAALFALLQCGALWSAFVLGWLVLCVHGALLARARRRLARIAVDHDERD